ncbi:hypothetical protein T440DRAFT_559443 [Neofusicoccum parvum]|nr:hypothetical protein T440DRAFT_559443 [Neofusicoccum parvum]
MMEHLRSQTGNADGDPTQTLSRDVSVLFNSPVQHYLPADFFAETKPSTHKIVPTWNYAAVQVYGKATIYFDTKAPSTDIFLSKQISDLSAFGEKQLMGRTDDEAWKVSEAPERYIDAMKKAIIGIEIEVSSMKGKWKMSQETSVGDRTGITEGFKALGTEVATEMARMVEERGTLYAKKKQERKERKV